MLHGVPDSMEIVDPDVSGRWIHCSNIAKNERDSRACNLSNDLLRDVYPDDGDAVNSSTDHASDCEPQAIRILAGGAQDHLIAPPFGAPLEVFNDRSIKRLADSRSDNSEDAALAAHQRAGLCVGRITELIDGLPDAPRQGRFHAWHSIDRAGDSGNRDSGAFGDIVDIHRDSHGTQPNSS
ncbi:MAG: hypothetical protein WAL74_09305 [Candidatus Acidiferrales bacterium]